jgi:microsomal dipeptidase-like Zn-dependent dipeptidase
VFDAMGEIRDSYGSELLGEIRASGLDAITVTLCDPKTFEHEAFEAATAGVLQYDRYIRSQPDLLLKATRTTDVERAQREGKLAIFYLFQTSTQFGRDLDRVDLFYGLGARSSQITYNFQNWAGAGCKERNDSGLTVFGLELVERMNRVGMLIDLSHAGMRTMADTIRASRAPVVISHTACAALHPNQRNTTDQNLRLLAEHGGVVGICQIRPGRGRRGWSRPAPTGPGGSGRSPAACRSGPARATAPAAAAASPRSIRACAPGGCGRRIRREAAARSHRPARSGRGPGWARARRRALPASSPPRGRRRP